MTSLRRLRARMQAAVADYRDRTVRDAEGLTAADRRLIAWVAQLKATESEPLS